MNVVSRHSFYVHKLNFTVVFVSVNSSKSKLMHSGMHNPYAAETLLQSPPRNDNHIWTLHFKGTLLSGMWRAVKTRKGKRRSRKEI